MARRKLCTTKKALRATKINPAAYETSPLWTLITDLSDSPDEVVALGLTIQLPEKWGMELQHTQCRPSPLFVSALRDLEGVNPQSTKLGAH